MKRRLSVIIMVMVMAIVMIAGCGSKDTSAQETENTKKTEQETPVTEKDPATQDTTEKDPATQDTTEKDIATSDVKHWKIQDSKLLGQTGPEDFVEFGSFEGSDIQDYAVVVSQNEANDMILIKQDAAFYCFDIKSNRLTLLNEGAVDSMFDAYEKWIYYVSTDETEYVIKDWKTADIEATPTGNYRANYNVCPNNSEVAGLDKFADIQMAVEHGDYRVPFDNGIVIEENGDMYDFYGQYISNVHLQKAIDGNVYPAGEVTTLIDEGKLYVYRFGKDFITIDLPEGSFTVVDVFYQMEDSEIKVASALLYNFEDRCMYKADGSSVNKLFGDVKDFFASDGQIFWTDGDNNGHVCKWFFDSNYAPVAEDVICVSHYRACKGFVVGEGKGIEFNGLNIFAF